MVRLNGDGSTLCAFDDDAFCELIAEVEVEFAEKFALATSTHSAARRHVDGGPRDGHCYRPITMPTWKRNRFAPPSSWKARR